jgi:spermidine/putrescine transport system ATP-binding protein
MVFQNYELFPHMTVFDNVAYGLKLRKVPREAIRRQVMEMLAVVRVDGLEDRGARQLSGGQQQRVALARALVNRPAVLLLDEPLSALDVKLRRQMQFELKAIQHRLGTTFVYVTHDQEEALLMSDRVGIMNHGRILQIGSPREIYGRPVDAFVADFVGSLNVLPVRVETASADAAIARPSPSERVVVGIDRPTIVGQDLLVAIRPERIRLTSGEHEIDPTETRLTATISTVDYAGPVTHYRATTAYGEVIIHQTNAHPVQDRAPGDVVVLSWPMSAAFVLPDGPSTS